MTNNILSLYVFVQIFSSGNSFLTESIKYHLRTRTSSFSSNTYQSSKQENFVFNEQYWQSSSRIKAFRISNLYGKPPPSSQFDLEAIEEYEKFLLTSEEEKENEEIYELDEINVVDNDDGIQVAYHIIPEELHMKRIDTAISKLEPNLSRSTCGNLISDGNVFCIEEPNKQSNEDGTSKDEKNSMSPSLAPITRKSEKVKQGQMLKIVFEQEESPTEIIPEKIPLNILFEDKQMIVINKAAGMVVHPAAGNWKGTLVNALAYYLTHESPYGSGELFNQDGDDEEPTDQNKFVEKDSKDGENVYFRPGIVHRLDKGTTGIIVVAKTKEALKNLSESFSERRVRKTYLAITVGNPGKRVRIDKPIGRHPIHRQRMRVVPDLGAKNNGHSMGNRSPTSKTSNNRLSKSIAGRRALSFVDTKAFDGKLSVVEVKIETGRTHQIRVHMQDRHTPIYGDDVYGLTDWNKILYKKYKIARPLLHAHRLEVDHPITGEKMLFVAPMADDMKMIAVNIWPSGIEERPEMFLES